MGLLGVSKGLSGAPSSGYPRQLFCPTRDQAAPVLHREQHEKSKTPHSGQWGRPGAPS